MLQRVGRPDLRAIAGDAAEETRPPPVADAGRLQPTRLALSKLRVCEADQGDDRRGAAESSEGGASRDELIRELMAISAVHAKRESEHRAVEDQPPSSKMSADRAPLRAVILHDRGGDRGDLHGVITFQAGVLKLDGSLTSLSINVGAGQTLQGVGFTTGAVSVASPLRARTPRRPSP